MKSGLLLVVTHQSCKSHVAGEGSESNCNAVGVTGCELCAKTRSRKPLSGAGLISPEIWLFVKNDLRRWINSAVRKVLCFHPCDDFCSWTDFLLSTDA
jgi:hypothetical protein